MSARALLLRLGLAVAVLVPSPARGQWIFDISGAWGPKERTIDLGAGYSWLSLSAVAGGAAVEGGLKPGLEWTPDRTKVYDAQGRQWDPREARTSPDIKPFFRLEVQPSWWGGVVMWDPRGHVALGAFGSLGLTSRSEVMGELRWGKPVGHNLSVRLRWR